MPSWLLHKTEMCNHKHGCVEHSLRGWYSSFLKGIAVKMFINSMFAALKPTKYFKTMLSWANQMDVFRFSLFLACMNTLYKALLCIMRRFNKNDKINAPIAGFLAALSIAMDTKSRRMFIAVMMVARLLDTVANIL